MSIIPVIEKKAPLTKSRQRGVGLIEVLVALLVFAIGVLGYASLQLSALKSTEVAHARALASGVAQDFLERILVNPEGDYIDASIWEADYPDLARPEGWTDCIDADCSADEMAVWDVNSVRWHAMRILPAGRVSVEPCQSSTAMACVIVAWGEQAPADCLTASGVARGLDVQCVVMEVPR